MSQAPFEQVGSLRIGTVDFVSPDEIKVALDLEAPDSIALNAGAPRPFPRVNSYLLIPVDVGLLVGQVEWITVERSPFPKRRGMQDFGVVDLPYPLRRLRLNPLGTLRSELRKDDSTFQRGVETLPSVGEAVLLPTEEQLRSIVESGEGRRIKIGSSPLAGSAAVTIDPDRMFGRHLAVLGNTGGGKSCSVAGLIRWSIEAATKKKQICHANARFIVLDPNGEYSQAFDKDGAVKARTFKVDPICGENLLKVPLWFWNSAEWSSFTQASARTQRPILRRALREVKAGRAGISQPTYDEEKLELRRYLSVRLTSIRSNVRSGAIQSEARKFGLILKAIENDLQDKSNDFQVRYLKKAQDAISDALQANHSPFPDKRTGKPVENYNPFNENQVRPIIDSLEESLNRLGGIVYQEGPGEDIPLPFKGTDLPDHIELISNEENVTQYLDFLISRIRTILSDPILKEIIDNDDSITLAQWLQDVMGSNEAGDARVSVLDLSLVPSELVHVIAAVVARMILEALQRYVKLERVSLPTVLVIEEAHTFIKQYRGNLEEYDAATICCQVFERIAREGRKFGLGLVLASQRPSELSPTVLSQCNTFLLHRISNDRDQDLVNRLVPDSLRGLLRELPVLPSQNAILLGWASELPMLVRMNDLPKEHQPRSEDPEFWDVWTGKEAREIDWKAIADDWQSYARTSDGERPGLGTDPNKEPSDQPNDSADEESKDPDDLPF